MAHPSEDKLERYTAQRAGCTCTWADDNSHIERLDSGCPVKGKEIMGKKHPDEDDVEVWHPITREHFYMSVARLCAQRSTCKRGHTGAVIVRGKRIIASGYNGAPPGLPHCLDVDCLIVDDIRNLGCQRAVHAEANAIAFAARAGIPTEGAAMWCTHGPCTKCAHQIISAGIVEVHYHYKYRLENLEEMERAGIKVIREDD